MDPSQVQVGQPVTLSGAVLAGNLAVVHAFINLGDGRGTLP